VARPVSKRLKRKTETLREAFGTAVTYLRVKKNWSQEQVAQKSGYVKQSIGNVERGVVDPSFPLVVALADMFEMSVSQLFARAERLHRKHATGNQIRP
jgi:DNA-binding XRE family transcriptional regulator